MKLDGKTYRENTELLKRILEVLTEISAEIKILNKELFRRA